MSKKKIQFVLDDNAQATLEALKDATRAESVSHVLRDAIGVYSALHALLRENGAGAKLAIIDRARHELQELDIPSLQDKRIVIGAKLSMVDEEIVKKSS